MKKILFKSGSTMIGGVEKVQIEYINFLSTRKEYDLKVVIENDNGENNILEKNINTDVEYLKESSYIEKIKNLRNKREKGLINKIKYNIALIKERNYSNKKFLNIYREYKPDIVIDFDSSLTKIIKKLKYSKNIVWIHSSIKRWKKKNSKIVRFMVRINLYDKIICICKEMLEELKKEKMIKKEKLDYIYNPVDFEAIKKMSELPFEEEEKKFLNYNYVLHISRLDCAAKDFETLLEGFDIAKKNGYNGKLYIIGDGRDKRKVEALKNIC